MKNERILLLQNSVKLFMDPVQKESIREGRVSPRNFLNPAKILGDVLLCVRIYTSTPRLANRIPSKGVGVKS